MALRKLILWTADLVRSDDDLETSYAELAILFLQGHRARCFSDELSFHLRRKFLGSVFPGKHNAHGNRSWGKSMPSDLLKGCMPFFSFALNW